MRRTFLTVLMLRHRVRRSADNPTGNSGLDVTRTTGTPRDHDVVAVLRAGGLAVRRWVAAAVLITA